MSIESLHRNWHLLHSPSFLPPFVTLHGSLLRARLPFTFREPRWISEMLWTFSLDGLRHHVRQILLRADFYQIDHLIIHDPLTYLVKSHINVLRLLVIPVIFSEMNSTLAVAMKSNYILYDIERLNQSFNHKAFFEASTVAMYSASVVERAIVSYNSAF